MPYVVRNCVLDPLAHNMDQNWLLNCGYEILKRDGVRLCKTVNITANNETVNLNLCKIIDSVKFCEHYGIIYSVTNITNMTAVYLDLWDGTVSTPITANGATLSGVSAKSFFIKTNDSSGAYAVVNASAAGLIEPVLDKKIFTPIIVVAKNTADTHLRFNFTTNTVLDIEIEFYFKYNVLNGGSIEWEI